MSLFLRRISGAFIALSLSAGVTAQAQRANPALEAQVGVAGLPNVYQSRSSKVCQIGNDCEPPFATVPTGKILKATNLNCGVDFLGTPSGGGVAFILLTGSKESPQIYDHFAVAAEDPLSAVNEPILTYFPAESRPRVRVISDYPMVVYCKLTGALLKP